MGRIPKSKSMAHTGTLIENLNDVEAFQNEMDKQVDEYIDKYFHDIVRSIKLRHYEGFHHSEFPVDAANSLTSHKSRLIRAKLMELPIFQGIKIGHSTSCGISHLSFDWSKDEKGRRREWKELYNSEIK